MTDSSEPDPPFIISLCQASQLMDRDDEFHILVRMTDEYIKRVDHGLSAQIEGKRQFCTRLYYVIHVPDLLEDCTLGSPVLSPMHYCHLRIPVSNISI